MTRGAGGAGGGPDEASAVLTFDFDSPSQRAAVEAALAPERGADVPGSTAALERRGEAALVIRVAAEDAGALRAALNSYLRWVQTAVEVHRLAAGSARPPPGGPGPGSRGL